MMPINLPYPFQPFTHFLEQEKTPIVLSKINQGFFVSLFHSQYVVVQYKKAQYAQNNWGTAPTTIHIMIATKLPTGKSENPTKGSNQYIDYII